jgi:hypothetical protein
MRVNFVIQKPLSALNATRCFSAALNFMIREQRRYFRHPEEIGATLESGEWPVTHLFALSPGGDMLGHGLPIHAHANVST